MSISIQKDDTLYSVFRKRVTMSPHLVAYHQFSDVDKQWCTYTWSDIAQQVAVYQQALQKELLQAGDRVAVMLRNSIEWILIDQAALGLGLVTVPLFSEDNATNCAYIMNDAGVSLLFVGNRRQLKQLNPVLPNIPTIKNVVCFESVNKSNDDERVVAINDWLESESATLYESNVHAEDLATIIYTSGTTGNPKGVMLTHKNIVTNVSLTSQVIDIDEQDKLVSFLPLSHIFERMAGYYLSMAQGAQVAYAQSTTALLEDMRHHRPTVLISVPRIYEKVLGRIKLAFKSPLRQWILQYAIYAGLKKVQQKKNKMWYLSTLFWPLVDSLIARRVRDTFGGNLRFAVSGGAALQPHIAKAFTAFGVPIHQGYGLTESSPVIAINHSDSDDIPQSIGPPIPGIEVRIADNGELLTRGDCVMQGYWNLPQATQEALDSEGWLHTGDIASMDEKQRLFIRGRIKEIIVMANGEKVPPADMELALLDSPIISQSMIYGEDKPFLIAILVLADIDTSKNQSDVAKDMRKHIAKLLKQFPAYARVRRVIIAQEAWTIDNGLLTPTLKIKRSKIEQSLYISD